MALESKELMTICLRKVVGLSKVKLTDAVWIWTEPHSMRLKIKLTVQKEVVNGAVLQQAAVVEFIIRNQQCKACEAAFAQGNWHAVVQVRQRVSHKRTFFFLEQLILKHESHMECIKIEVRSTIYIVHSTLLYCLEVAYRSVLLFSLRFVHRVKRFCMHHD